MATYEKLDYGSPDGSNWGGATTDKLGCYGATPVVQYPSCGAASTYTVFSQTSSDVTTFGFSSALQMSSFIRQVSTLTVACRNFGIIT